VSLVAHEPPFHMQKDKHAPSKCSDNINSLLLIIFVPWSEPSQIECFFIRRTLNYGV